MIRHSTHEDAARSIIEVCRAGLGPEALRGEVLLRLRRAVPVDALWWAMADPATLLFTRTYSEEIPHGVMPYFVENEFLVDDVNKWVELARDQDGVRTLVQATGGAMSQSARFLDVFRPLGLGDELRAVLRVHGACWGFLCLHREQSRPFSAEDAQFVQRVAPHVAEAIRVGLVVSNVDGCDAADAPGVLLIDNDGALVGSTAAAERWLDELGHTASADLPLPAEVLVVVALLREAAADASVPRLRVRTRAGRWAILHASRLPSAGGPTVAVVIESASAAEVAPIVMLAYGLSDQERTVTALVCQGLSTTEIATSLRISPNTVQDHLKSVFDKVGVHSRRELVIRIVREQYLPPARASRPLAPGGFFA